jgi:mono/diheme cytochrome c family protein
MRYASWLIAMAVISAGCRVVETEQPGSNSTGMGMGNGMMARHHAQIPQGYAGLSNPIANSEESINRGAEIYTTHCASCHGDGGMGDGPAGVALDPLPSAVAHSSQMMGDDYLYWRISEGGAPFDTAMPAWSGTLDENARWDVKRYS